MRDLSQSVAPDLSDWVRGKVFCLVGGTGLIGRALADCLRRWDARDVVVVSRRAADQRPGLTWRGADLVDPQSLSGVLPKDGIVVHLAALKYAGQGALNPDAFFDLNVRGTWNLLNACREAGVAKFIYASTGLVYGVPARIPVRETDPASPLSIYAATKLAGETLAHGFAAEFGLPVVIARLANIYGDSVDPETVWGRILNLAAGGLDVELRSLRPERDYLHVNDAAEGLLRLAAAEFPERSVTVNVSTGVGTSVGRLATIVAEEAGKRGRQPAVLEATPRMEDRIPSLVLDNELLLRTTRWRPPVTVEAGIRRAFQTLVAASHARA